VNTSEAVRQGGSIAGSASSSRLRLAILGCGAITEHLHLPVAVLYDQFKVVALVDASLPRAQRLADRYGVPTVTDDYRHILGSVDAAIVALPNYLHAPVTLELLRHGVHVLVEKPMALRADDCEAMVKAADEAGVVLAVGLVRRYYESSQLVKSLLEDDFLGTITRIDVREGRVLNLPMASDFRFRKEAAGGGVFTDIGIHVLDLILWWFGPCVSFIYEDDAMGGVEADGLLRLRLQSGARGVVELSRTRDLRNTWIIEGARGTLEVGTMLRSQLRVCAGRRRSVVLSGDVRRDGARVQRTQDVFHGQLDDFAEAILTRRAPRIPGPQGQGSVALLEACYAARRPLRQPWLLLKELEFKSPIAEVCHAGDPA
jgi:predicted dehydrogenase